MPAGTRFAEGTRFQDRYLTEANWRIVEALRHVADARGRSLLELAFGWLLAQAPVTSVIAGATRPEQVDANVKAVAHPLTPEELADIAHAMQ
jgi:aryl-alcohol dehydrogenase-like predicted oxidoreductase